MGGAAAFTAFYGAGRSEDAFLFQAISTVVGMFTGIYDAVAIATGEGCEEDCAKILISLPVFLGAVVGLIGGAIIEANTEGGGPVFVNPPEAMGMTVPLVMSF